MSLNGIEKTFTEPNLAGMLNMRKGPLHEMLGQATQQQLAQPRSNSPTTPPIWQGRAARGENAAILGRNPDGTFQVRLNGVEKTFKEPQVAAMTRLKKGPLYEMLGQATKGRLVGIQWRMPKVALKVRLKGPWLFGAIGSCNASGFWHPPKENGVAFKCWLLLLFPDTLRGVKAVTYGRSQRMAKKIVNVCAKPQGSPRSP